MKHNPDNHIVMGLDEAPELVQAVMKVRGEDYAALRRLAVALPFLFRASPAAVDTFATRMEALVGPVLTLKGPMSDENLEAFRKAWKEQVGASLVVASQGDEPTFERLDSGPAIREAAAAIADLDPRTNPCVDPACELEQGHRGGHLTPPGATCPPPAPVLCKRRTDDQIPADRLLTVCGKGPEATMTRYYEDVTCPECIGLIWTDPSAQPKPALAEAKVVTVIHPHEPGAREVEAHYALEAITPEPSKDAAPAPAEAPEAITPTYTREEIETIPEHEGAYPAPDWSDSVFVTVAEARAAETVGPCNLEDIIALCRSELLQVSPASAVWVEVHPDGKQQRMVINRQGAVFRAPVDDSHLYTPRVLRKRPWVLAAEPAPHAPGCVCKACFFDAPMGEYGKAAPEAPPAPPEEPVDPSSEEAILQAFGKTPREQAEAIAHARPTVGDRTIPMVFKMAECSECPNRCFVADANTSRALTYKCPTCLSKSGVDQRVIVLSGKIRQFNARPGRG